MFTKTTLALFLGMAIMSNANSQECNGGEPPVKPFKFTDIKNELDTKADEINAKWVEESSQMTASEALAKRQERVDQFYTDFTDKRTKEYKDAVCYVTSTKKCASTPGKKKFCPMSVEPPSNRTAFDFSKLQQIDNDFDVPPHLSGSAINYVVKKTGDGSNTAGFKAPVYFKTGSITSSVNRELDLVTEYLQSRIKLDNPSGGVHGTVPSANCANIASELLNLKTLKDSGAISQTDYDKLHQQKLKACLPS